MGIVVIGQTTIDIVGVGEAPNMLRANQLNSVKITPGGVAGNMAADLANMDLQPTLVSTVSDDPFGQVLFNYLNDQGVNMKYVARTKDGSGRWMVMYDQNNQLLGNSFVPADLRILDEILNKDGDRIFRGASCIAVELCVNMVLLSHILKIAKRNRVPVYGLVRNSSEVIDMVPILKDLDCLVCNLQEAATLFPGSFSKLLNMKNRITSEKEPGKKEMLIEEFKEEAVKEICNVADYLHLKNFVVTLGSFGSVYIDEKKRAGICRTTPARVVSRIGVGEACFCGIAAALAEKKSLREACQIGSHVAFLKLNVDQAVIPKTNYKIVGLSGKC